MSIFVFRNANVLDLQEGALVDGMDVVVVDGHVAEVGRQLAQPRATDAVFDLDGLTLMPGMIDCHVHVTASSVNLGVSARLPNALGVIRSLPILKGMLMRGFTSVRDAGGGDWALGQAAKDGLIESPRLFTSGKALSQTGGHGDFRMRSDQLESCACSFRIGNIGRVVDGVDEVRRATREELTKGATQIKVMASGGVTSPNDRNIGRVVDGVDEVRRATREELTKGATQIKVMASGGVTSPNDPIGNTGYSMDELRAIVDEAAAWQTYVMAHAYTPRAIRRAVEVGVRTIEHGNLVDEATAVVLKDAGVFVVPTLITFDMLSLEGASLGLPPESIAKVDDVRLAGREAVAMLHRAGVKMGYGSDLLGESHRHQSEELRVRSEIVGSLEALRSATTVAAEIVQHAGKLGVVRPGAIADLLIVRGNPLRDIGVLTGQGEGIAAILKDGKFVKNELRARTSTALAN